MGTEALWIPIAASLVGAVASKALAPKQADQPAPTPVAPTAAPQASQAPATAAFAASNAAAASAQGPSSTLLTGLGGVPNSSLNLGKNTTLGS